MKNLKKLIVLALMFALILTLVTGCGADSNTAEEAPINLIVWTYYNGTAKEAFDDTVKEFNNTIGLEENIIVDAYSQGDVNMLSDAVLAAAKGDVGANKMPHVFAAYSDSAYKIDELGQVVDLNKYFTEKDLSEYRAEFLDYGRFGDENNLKILPVAKSTECLFVNTTDFNKFAEATGANLDNLQTWEGIHKTAENYYNWSGGKALFGIDSMANFMLASTMQLGTDFYIYNDDLKYEFSKETAKVIWDNFYVPYINGYYANIGRFRSDDTKTGDILAYVGSTSGSSYFPEQIEKGIDNLYPIEGTVLPYPTYAGKDSIAIHQGAGMVIAKSDETHEDAAATFIKWFTDSEQNLDFAIKTGYLPVKNDVMNIVEFENKVQEKELVVNEISVICAETTFKMIENATLYANKPSDDSYSLRKVLENNLIDFANADLAKIAKITESGSSKAEAIESFITEENFNNWYLGITAELDKF